MIDEKMILEQIADFKRSQKSTNCDYLTGYISALSAIEGMIAEQPKVGEWIPCSERLPDDRKEKLVYLSSNRFEVAVYNEHRLPHSSCPIGWGYRVPDSYIDFENETVIAWMPLPEPYKGVD